MTSFTKFYQFISSIFNSIEVKTKKKIYIIIIIIIIIINIISFLFTYVAETHFLIKSSLLNLNLEYPTMITSEGNNPRLYKENKEGKVFFFFAKSPIDII